MGSRTSARPAPAVVLALTAAASMLGVAEAGTTASAGQLQGPPTSEISVSIPRTVFPDGLYRADFTIEGGCPTDTSAVDMVSSSCADEDPAARHASGTVRMAELGFDAAHRVEAGDADRPVVETANAAAPEQTSVVVIDLKAGGDLTVEMTATPEMGLDPRPVDGSASDGGVISDRSIVWELPDTSPGTYEFSARFAPTAPPGFSGSFRPQVSVSSVRTADALLDYVGDGGDADEPTESLRTSTLIMQQHVAPALGPPIATAGEYWGNGGLYPQSFESWVAFDAAGAYNSPSSGPISAVAEATLHDIAPGLEKPNASSTAYARPTLPGAEKVDADFRRVVDDQNQQALRFTLTGYPPQGNPPSAAEPPAPLAGTFWDGDAVVVGGVASLGSFSSLNQAGGGEPTNPGGSLEPDWDGSSAVAWSGIWANTAPFGEVNALNHAQQINDLQNDHLGGTGTYGVLSTTGASFMVVSAGGDIDNRSAEVALVGESATVSAPVGEEMIGALSFSFRWAGQPYEYKITTTDRDYTLTPKIPAGGYWLETKKNGYHRDPAVAHQIYVIGHRFDAETTGGRGDYPVEWMAEGSAVVPRGATAVVDAIDFSGRSHRRLLGPGVWRTTLTSKGLSISADSIPRLSELGT